MKVDGLAILAAAGGAGAVTAAVFLAVRGRPEGLTAITLSALALGMVGVVILCGTGDIRIGIVGAFLGGAAVTLSGTGTQTLMQNSVKGAIRGRVMSLYGMIHRGAPAIGALVMGIGAKIVGLQLAIAGLSLLLCLSLLVWVMPRRRRMTAALERGQDESADAAAGS